MIYVLKNKALRLEDIQLHYNILMAKNIKNQKITELVTRNYQWPEVIRDIEKDIKGRVVTYTKK